VAGCGEAERNSRISTIQSLKWVATGAWIAGGGLIAAAGIHHLLTRRAARDGTTVSVAIDPVGLGGGLSVRGVF
jgi:hypothetical protein